MVSEIVEAIVQGALEWGVHSRRRAVRWGCTTLLVVICLALLGLVLWAPIF